MLSKRSAHRSIRISSLFLLLISILFVYSRSLSGAFVFDDILFIRDNPVLADSVGAIFRYMPLRFFSFLTFSVNYYFGGTSTLGYHLVNLFIHMVNTLLVYWFVRRLSHHHWAAWFCAAFFSLHPLQTEAVAYITQRFTSLAACFYLLTLCLLLSRYRWASFVSALLAMFTKENTLTIPVVVLMTEYVLRYPRHQWWKPIGQALPYGLIAGCAYAVFVLFPVENVQIAAHGLPQVEGVGMSRSDYALTQIPVLVRYLKLFLFPMGQTIIHDVPTMHSLLHPEVVGSLAVLCLLAGVSIWTLKRYPLICYGIWFFFLTISIESSVIPLGEVMMEHRMYLPSVGLILSLCAAAHSFIQAFPTFRRFVIGLALVVLAGYAGTTYQRVNVWHDGFSLWSDAVAKSPQRSLGYWGLSMAHIERGDGVLAEESLRTAIRLNPGTVFPYINLGIIYTNQGKYPEAEDMLRRATAIDPENIAALNALGTMLAKQMKTKEAVSLFESVIALDPDNAAAYNNLGSIAAQNGENERAKELFTKALAIDPAYANARENLSKVR